MTLEKLVLTSFSLREATNDYKDYSKFFKNVINRVHFLQIPMLLKRIHQNSTKNGEEQVDLNTFKGTCRET